MTFYYTIIFVAVVLGVAAQLLLKIGAVRSGLNIGIMVLNTSVAIGLGLMVLSMLLSVRALNVIPLRDMAFILPSAYILIPFFSHLFLKERISRRTLVGTLIVIIGMVLFNMPTNGVF